MINRQPNIFSVSDWFFYGLLTIGLLSIVVCSIYISPTWGMLIMTVPFVVLITVFFATKPYWAFISIFVANYFIMGVTRYIPALPGGVVIDVLLIAIFAILILKSLYTPFEWKRLNNALLYLALVWLIYCIGEILNPETTPTLWLTSIRSIGFYLFIFVFLTIALLNKYRDLKRILYLWAIFTLLAVLKAIGQKIFGFDQWELHWLFVDGNSKTHIIQQGIRYFSFFTDAASFGCGMALSMVVFSISAMYVHNKKLKIFFIVIAIISCYGMMISGTRAAIVLPFVGYTVFILLTKKWKMLIAGIIVIGGIFFFFNNTYIGHSNNEIRRMRSAFNASDDASFNVRLENQKKMREFMPHHPFGIGVGKAKHANMGDHMYNLPTDSSLVFLWVETGIVGLIIFLSIYILVLARGVYDILFRIKNSELKGILSALVAGISGILVTSYGNEVLHQFPNGPIIYMCMAFIFMGREFDRQLSIDKNRMPQPHL